MRRTNYAGDRASVAAARHDTVQQMRDWDLSGCSDAASLLVSELATNAVRHAHSGFALEITRAESVVHIVVTDGSFDPPVWRKSTPESSSGFGLNIVNELSTGWGWDLDEHGKRVWVDIGALEDPRQRPD